MLIAISQEVKPMSKYEFTQVDFTNTEVIRGLASAYLLIIKARKNKTGYSTVESNMSCLQKGHMEHEPHIEESDEVARRS
jgi:hypothetical protein